jgi:hypothetical protein
MMAVQYSPLGAADDAREPDGLSVFGFADAQERARAWFKDKAREQAGDAAALDRPYTVAAALAGYRADYLRRGGKAVDRLDWSAEALILPELGGIQVTKLTKARIQAWHQKLAESPPRLRTKPGGTPRYREPDNGAEAVRRRRSTANRVLTILKAALNHPTPKGNVPTTMHGGRSVPSAKPMQRGCVICQTTRPVD